MLFGVWSAVAVVAEVPTGALADRFSRRACLSAAGFLQATAYACWVLAPGFPGFAAGFVLWGVGGTLTSGAMEALLYDAMAAVGEEDGFTAALGRISAAGLVAGIPAAAAAMILLPLGGYAAVGWVSVAVCLAGAGLAARLPEPPRTGDEDEDEEEGYLDTLRAGLREVRDSRPVRRAVLALALVSGLDAVEEYFALLTSAWGIPPGATPAALLAVSLAGAAGAWWSQRLGPGRTTTALLLAVAAGLLAATAVIGRPAGLLALVAYYAVYRLVLVVVSARLQREITGASRATVTSAAALAEEIPVYAVYLAWTFGGVLLTSALVAAVSLVLWLLREAGSAQPERT